MFLNLQDKMICQNVPDLSWEIQILIVNAVTDNLLELDHKCAYETLPFIFVRYRYISDKSRMLFHRPIRERLEIVDLVVGPQHGIIFVSSAMFGY